MKYTYWFDLHLKLRFIDKNMKNTRNQPKQNKPEKKVNLNLVLNIEIYTLKRGICYKIKNPLEYFKFIINNILQSFIK